METPDQARISTVLSSEKTIYTKLDADKFDIIFRKRYEKYLKIKQSDIKQLDIKQSDIKPFSDYIEKIGIKKALGISEMYIRENKKLHKNTSFKKVSTILFLALLKSVFQQKSIKESIYQLLVILTLRYFNETEDWYDFIYDLSRKKDPKTFQITDETTNYGLWLILDLVLSNLVYESVTNRIDKRENLSSEDKKILIDVVHSYYMSLQKEDIKKIISYLVDIEKYIDEIFIKWNGDTFENKLNKAQTKNLGERSKILFSINL